MDYETNQEIAQYDVANPAYDELRTAYDKRQLKLYDALAQKANTAFAPTKTSCGLWTANSNLTCNKGNAIEGYAGVGDGNGQVDCNSDSDCPRGGWCDLSRGQCVGGQSDYYACTLSDGTCTPGYDSSECSNGETNDSDIKCVTDCSECPKPPPPQPHHPHHPHHHKPHHHAPTPHGGGGSGGCYTCTIGNPEHVTNAASGSNCHLDPARKSSSCTPYSKNFACERSRNAAKNACQTGGNGHHTHSPPASHPHPQPAPPPPHNNLNGAPVPATALGPTSDDKHKDALAIGLGVGLGGAGLLLLIWYLVWRNKKKKSLSSSLSSGGTQLSFY